MWTSFTSNRRVIYSPARVLFEPKKLNHHALAEDLATSDFKRWSYLTCPALPCPAGWRSRARTSLNGGKDSQLRNGCACAPVLRVLGHTWKSSINDWTWHCERLRGWPRPCSGFPCVPVTAGWQIDTIPHLPRAAKITGKVQYVFKV
jgi:hypothetical protein